MAGQLFGGPEAREQMLEVIAGEQRLTGVTAAAIAGLQLAVAMVGEF